MSLPFILPKNAPFKAYKGSNFEQPMRYAEKIDGVNEPKDITGYRFRGQIRALYASEDSLIDMTTENTKLPLVDAAEGLFKMFVPLEDLADLDVPLTQDKVTDIPYADFVFDIEMIAPASDPVMFMKGVFRVYAEVTRDDL